MRIIKYLNKNYLKLFVFISFFKLYNKAYFPNFLKLGDKKLTFRSIKFYKFLKNEYKTIFFITINLKILLN